MFLQQASYTPSFGGLGLSHLSKFWGPPHYPDALLLDDWPNYEKRAIGESPFTDSPVESPFSTGDIPSPLNDLDASASCGGEMTVSWTNTTDDITAHFVRLAKGFQERQAAHATI